MDVRQFAFLVRQPSAALKSRDAFLGLPKRGLALILANALFWQPLLAQAEGIVVSAPGTTVGAAGNGVPVVNIATPNGSGLSHNQFKDYNVGANGVILNNATERTQSTQLGGLILGNPNLQGRAANIILNEVNGGSPSQLRGYTEVAGQSAKVIVANPYGITCSGCGFINTPQRHPDHRQTNTRCKRPTAALPGRWRRRHHRRPGLECRQRRPLRNHYSLGQDQCADQRAQLERGCRS